jgi:DNA mismatch repair protein MLH1
MSNGTEEYGHVVKMLQRYAIQLAGRVGVSCKKAGIGGGSDVQTSVSLTPDSAAAIKTIFGTQIFKGLSMLGPVSNEALQVQLSGCVSVPTFHQKSLTFILFINGRLVDSAPIKRAVTSLYAQFLPKGTSPFVYLNLVMPPQSVDVNVHPTKSEVFFLHEMQILEFVDQSIREAIRTSPLALETPSVIQPAVVPAISTVSVSAAAQPNPITPSETRPVQLLPRKQLYPFQMVHSDPKTRTLDLFLTRATKQTRVKDETTTSEESIELTEVAVRDPIEERSTTVQVVDPPRPQRQQQLAKYVPKPIALDSGTEDPRELTSPTCSYSTSPSS